MKSGKMIGKWITYDTLFRVRLIEHYDTLGKKEGTWVWLDEKGDTIKAEVYKNNELVE